MTDIRAFLSAWGYEDCPASLIAERENKVYRVDTKQGPLALRLHRVGYRKDTEMASELAWMAALSEAGLKVPKPVLNKSNAFTCKVDGVVADVQTWIDGKPMGVDGRLSKLPRSVGSFRLLGQEMAKLHQISDNWSLPASFERPSWDLEGLLGDNPVWGRFWENSQLSQAQKALLSEARFMAIEHLESLLPELDYGLIHADLVPENVMVTENGISMIDFDDSGWGFRLFELATTINRLNREPNCKHLSEAVINGYTQEREIDLTNLSLFQLLRSFTYTGWIISRMEEPGSDVRCARFIQTSENLARNYLNQ